MFEMLRPRVRRAFHLAVRRKVRTGVDIEAELRFHLEMRVDQLVARGWSREDAEREARRRFGPSWDDAVRHLHRSGQAREERLAMRERIASLWYDMRYAVRALRRAPRYAAAAVLTLALGLGATTVIFSLVDHIVLRPLPYAEPERLVVVREIVGELRDVYPTMPANASHFLEWRRSCELCDGLAAVTRSAVTLTADGDPQRLGAARVSANLFALLGVRPALGRDFRAEEDQPGRGRVVLLSDGFWRRQFGADPSVIGRTITLNDAAFVVIGVLPPGGAIPGGDGLGALVGLPRQIDIYRPLALTEQQATAGGQFDYAVIARLRPGATADQVRAQLDIVGAQFAEQLGGGATLHSAVVPLQAQIVGDIDRPLLLLLAAVAAVLLIVCVNLISLSLARNVGRQRESAVRVALGAGLGRLARLALIESLAVAVAGGLLGLLLTRWGLHVLVALAPATLPRISEVQLDGRVFGAALILTAVVALAVGALPAIRAGRVHPGEALKAGGRTATGSRAASRRRSLFIGAQVAFSTLLLVGAGLFLTSFVRVLGVDRGFDTDRTIAFDVALPMATYPTFDERTPYYDRVLAEIGSIPGVDAVAVASALPLEGETWVDAVGRAEDIGTTTEAASANFRFVSPGYFAAIGTPIRRGRPIEAGDRGRQVVVVSERTARTLWPGENPIGKRVTAGANSQGRRVAEVVGVAADAGTSTLEEEGSLVVYLPSWEYPPSLGTLIVRTTSAPQTLAAAVRTAIRRVDPSVPVPRVRTMAEVVSATVAGRRFQLGLLALFAGMALVTASIGIYGVISQSLANRTGEIGIRMALGARPRDVHRLVLREGLSPVAVGLALGIGAALAGGRTAEGLLFGVRAADPLTFGTVAALLTLIAVVACTIPARRATRTPLADMLRGP